MPSKIEENLPPTNEGYGTKEYWSVDGEDSTGPPGPADIVQGAAIYQVRTRSYAWLRSR